MIQTILLPGYLPPAQNALMRCHWSKRARLVQECKDLVECYARKDGLLTTSTVKRRVTLKLIRAGRQRERDTDSSHKCALDALVASGLLVDDSPRWCELTPLQQERGAIASTVITLEDI